MAHQDRALSLFHAVHTENNDCNGVGSSEMKRQHGFRRRRITRVRHYRSSRYDGSAVRQYTAVAMPYVANAGVSQSVDKTVVLPIYLILF